MRSLWVRVFTVLWFPTVALLIWHMVTLWKPNLFFTQPARIGAVAAQQLSPQWFVDVVMPTLILTVGGYFFGALFGLVAGTLIGSHPLLVRVLGPVAIFVRSTPAAATIPVILAIFGLGPLSLYVVVSVSVGFQILLITMLGVSRTDAGYQDVADVLRLSFTERLVLVRLPGAMPDILVALQASVQTALLVALTVEILAGGSGIGRYVSEALGLFRMPSLWIAVFVVGIIGVVLHELYFAAEKRLAPWYFHQKGVHRG
jgi:sulfonate transport system permease protein